MKMSPTHREEHRLRVSENKVLRRTFAPKTEKVIGGWEKYIMGSFIILLFT
jgi:hypothetical protein